MATSGYAFDLPFVAGEDLSAKKFYGGKFSVAADRTVLLATAGTVDGVIVDSLGGNGGHATLRVGGIGVGIAGGAITRGDRLTTDAAGKFVVLTADGAGSVYTECIGKALESAVEDDIFSFLIMPMGPVLV